MKATKENHNLYNPRLQKNAHSLRYSMTKAEACLWKYVLRAKMTGYTFNRQRPVLKYVADFMCKELQLIIEVDGYSHQLEYVIKKDKKRQDALEKAGFRVLRFTDDEVLKGIHNVARAIEFTIEDIAEKRKITAPQEGDKQPPPPARAKAGEPAPSRGGQQPTAVSGR